jgi:hypothetical protein
VPIPERLQRTQQQQFRQQELLIARMNQQKMRRVDDPTQRRQPSRQSVWNIMEPRTSTTTGTKATTAAAAAAAAASTRNTDSDNGDHVVLDNDVTCSSCGAQRVETLFSNASHRNQDMAKAETWGNKDRAGDIVTRYRCLQCGKTWNEEA